MCIRDSAEGVDVGDDFRLDMRIHDAEDLVFQRLAAKRAKRCLLYTSDAADERSSVDLGGRRII